MNLLTNDEVIKNKFHDNIAKDKKEQQKAIDDIKKKSELFSKIINEEKNKVDSKFAKEMQKMKEEEKRLEQMIKSLEE